MFSYFLVNSPIKNTTRKSGVFVCPMSSVSAWSTAAAVHGTTARAIHESPVISAKGEIFGFSCDVFLPDQGRDEKRLTHGRLLSILTSPMAILGIYG